MRTGHADRVWMIGGALGAVVLLAIGWFMFVGPKKSQTNALHEQAAVAELRLGTLQRELAELRQQHELLPQYRAELAGARRALPTVSGLSDFLRELQTAGDTAAVSVSGVIVGVPSQVTAAGTRLYSLPITLTATGNSAALFLFLDQLQQVQPRAVLIGTLNTVPGVGTDGATVTEAVNLTLSLQVFVAPTIATSASPAPTTQPTTK
jgi:hypothetical protein